MLLLKPYIFNKCPEIISVVSTKTGAGRTSPYFFNMSFSVGDDENIVKENRKFFFEHSGINPEKAAYQRQVHGDNISVVIKVGLTGESDAMITDKPGIALAVSIADCVPVLLYSPDIKTIAGVHSGWRGTQKKILLKVLNKLKESGSDPENIIAYIGPSINKNIYEVGKEVAGLFDKKYISLKAGKYFLDVSGVNLDILLNFGLKINNIQVSQLCTYAMKDILHSYRREGERSGRSFAVIQMKENN
ncbi:MAG: peptidoglycan editing factor PgeF [Ignavibacteriales bacterium]|nr:MAG: peptidoglycan editing factor PgeF [Ignavibacteriales bacterium]